MPDQNPMWTRCLGGFSVKWVTKLLISPVKKRIFCTKTTKFGIFVHCWLIWCPVGGLVGGCGARAVSRKTPIYFICGVPIYKDFYNNCDCRHICVCETSFTILSLSLSLIIISTFFLEATVAEIACLALLSTIADATKICDTNCKVNIQIPFSNL